MLIQGPAPDPKRKWNISSFPTLPHLLDCLICTRNPLSIVLLGMIGGWDRSRGGSFISECMWWDKGWVLSRCFFYFCFCLLVSHDLPLF